MVMAGGDGSLMTLVTRAVEAGCDILSLVCCVLPYGTGNDLCRSLNWGGNESSKIFRSMPKLVREICLNCEVKDLDIWSIIVKFKQGGTTLELDSKTKNYKARNEEFFERYMVSYFGMGEDARVVMGFERKRTKSRFLNNCVYGIVGLWNVVNCCGVPQ
jgi:diacylglycerol kinase family enzyme